MPYDFETPVNNTIQGLEEIAKQGREAWEALFRAINDAEMRDEIIAFLAEFVQEESEYEDTDE